ncbi:MAG: 50S ribosomal protein L4 [Kiritimatiellae bacterium]|jgi:large subunit ribosomal protein L4|nr:50S ribosomal protein L4 [Kiritimatiellia bacterium]
MSKIEKFDVKGSAAGEIEFSDSLLVTDRGEQAVHDVVVAWMNAGRAGTASTLSKGEVAGSNKKPWKQKGTGRARAGYRQSPIWRGGAVAFGPKPKSFAVKVNKKVTQLAYNRALSDRIVEGAIKVVEKFDLEAPKTKELASVLKTLGVTKPALIVTGDFDEKVFLAGRNLPRVEVIEASEVNVYQLVRFPVIIADEAGMKILEERLG